MSKAYKNYFPLPNAIFSLNLSPGEIAVYSYLLYCEDRKTYQCYPSYKTIGRAEDMKAYLDAANARGLLPMFYLALVSGLRKGELVALLWSDLDIEKKTIFVNKQYVRNPSGELTLSRRWRDVSSRLRSQAPQKDPQ